MRYLAVKDPPKEPKQVRGHICSGLIEHWEYAHYGCIPRLGNLGELCGCDDTNHIYILYCPYCGIKLADPPVRVCSICDKPITEPHEDWCSKEGF